MKLYALKGPDEEFVPYEPVREKTALVGIRDYFATGQHPDYPKGEYTIVPVRVVEVEE